ncbi:MAG TPA: HisA/HisF-related TIM barrel protein, partial [Candidatus Limnocylindrales bacterium]
MTGNGAASPAFDLLPAIDLSGGRVVRLLRGDYGAATTYGEDAAAVADAFVAGGARWLHVVDLDGARDPAARQTRLVAAIIARVGSRA